MSAWALRCRWRLHAALNNNNNLVRAEIEGAACDKFEDGLLHQPHVPTPPVLAVQGLVEQ